MILERLVVGPFASNCYIVGCEKTGEAVVIDPGDEGNRITKLIKAKGLKVKYIINTHGHIDHIGANEAVKEATGAPILIHQGDAKMLQHSERISRDYFGMSVSSPPADKLLTDGEELPLGIFTIKVIHTPGHSPGGICLEVDNILFTGDTLFALGIGRTDMPGGDMTTLLNGIKGKLFSYPDSTIVYPGHGPSTSIGQEKRGNPFL